MHLVDIYWLVMPSLDPEGFVAALDRRHRLPRRRAGSAIAFGVCAHARPARRPGQGSLPRRVASVQAAMSMSSHSHGTERASPRTRVRGRDRLQEGDRGRRRLAGHLRRSARSGRVGILRPRDGEGRRRDGRAARAGRARQGTRSASSTRCLFERRPPPGRLARRAAPRASTATAGSIASKGHRPHPDRARDGRGRRRARCPTGAPK